MMRFTLRARGTTAALAAVVSSLLLGACNPKNELLAPQQPGVISPSSVNSSTAADALYVGALGRWKNAMNGNGNNTEALWNWEALFTDELQSSDTFSQRNDADQRNLQTFDAVLTPIWNNVMQARGRARDAINAELAFNTSAVGKTHVGEMYYMMGYIEMIVSEAFCNGVDFGETVNGNPVYGPSLPNTEGFKLAIAHLDSAASFLTGTDASTTNVLNGVRIAKARAQVDLADYAGAAGTVAAVPTNFQYTFDYSATTQDNEWWTMGFSVKRYVPGDTLNSLGQRIQNALPFASAGDPRVVVTSDGKTKAEDNTTLYKNIENWSCSACKDDPIPVASGVDARLIEAENKLHSNDIAGMMTILNALRAAPQTLGKFTTPVMPALATPGDATSARDLFFREKAFWQFQRGYRMDDLRRLVRQYGLTQDKVFPTGPFARNGTANGSYGTEVALPVPDAEITNPNFHGCLDTKA